MTFSTTIIQFLVATSSRLTLFVFHVSWAERRDRKEEKLVLKLIAYANEKKAIPILQKKKKKEIILYTMGKSKLPKQKYITGLGSYKHHKCHIYSLWKSSYFIEFT